MIQNFIFALILELLTTTKVDIFKKTSLFSNKNLIILLELSVIIFVFWLLTLAIIYLSNTLGDRIILKKEQKELSSNEKPILEYEPRSRGTLAYLNLAKEVILKNGTKEEGTR